MKFQVSGYIANQDSSHLTPRIADERDRPVAYVLQPEYAGLLAMAPELLNQLIAASNYIDALGGDSRGYRSTINKATK